MLNTGDIFICNSKKDSNIFWKSSQYFFIKNIEEDITNIIDVKFKNFTYSFSFLKHLLSTGAISVIKEDDIKAKFLLAIKNK